MDRMQLLLVGLPLFLFSTDILNLFITNPPPPKPSSNHHHHHNPNPKPHIPASVVPDFPTQQSNGIGGGLGYGHTVTIDFCSSCSFKGTAVTMKNMLETQFPGIHVALANYPPSPPKRILSKLVPVVQVGVFAAIMAGDQIFPRLGISPPPWYYTLRANRFGTISATWLFGNFIQSSLQSSGAFEVSFDGEQIFSKLREQRFPGEIELRDLIGKRLAGSGIVDGAGGNLWA
ncbi:selT-like protein [Silene latifolia]|uniref:selT-like protein n=1 Tax=Silene latifolia TaxID=37657 RepID=UPI003D76CBFA